jgi:hypothetical protein
MDVIRLRTRLADSETELLFLDEVPARAEA